MWFDNSRSLGVDNPPFCSADAPDRVPYYAIHFRVAGVSLSPVALADGLCRCTWGTHCAPPSPNLRFTSSPSHREWITFTFERERDPARRDHTGRSYHGWGCTTDTETPPSTHNIPRQHDANDLVFHSRSRLSCLSTFPRKV